MEHLEILEAADHTAWLKSNQRAHYSLFASFLAFNILNILTGKLLAHHYRLKESRSAAQAQHA